VVHRRPRQHGELPGQALGCGTVEPVVGILQRCPDRSPVDLEQQGQVELGRARHRAVQRVHHRLDTQPRRRVDPGQWGLLHHAGIEQRIALAAPVRRHRADHLVERHGAVLQRLDRGP